MVYAAEEFGLPYEYTEVDFSKGDNKTPEFLRLHPLGKTPVMTTDQGPLFESGAICRFMANTTKTDLYGKNDFERAHTDQWMDFFSIHLGRWIGTYGFEKVLRKKFNMGEPKQEVIREAEGYLEQQLGMVNAHFEKSKHLSGETFTIADIFAFAYVCLLYTSPSPRDLSTSRMPSSA